MPSRFAMILFASCASSLPVDDQADQFEPVQVDPVISLFTQESLTNKDSDRGPVTEACYKEKLAGREHLEGQWCGESPARRNSQQECEKYFVPDTKTGTPTKFTQCLWKSDGPACKANGQFCEGSSIPSLPPAPTRAPTPAPAPAVGESCPVKNFKYHPNLAGEGETTEVVWQDCQARCASVPSCAFFSWTPSHTYGVQNGVQNGACRLSGSSSTRQGASGVIAGPSRCTAANCKAEYSSAPTHPRKNVLFVIVDDLRPSTGAYNFTLPNGKLITPRMDELASSGTTFSRAYTQLAFCAPSRQSFLSGRRPDTMKAWGFYNNFREIGVGDAWMTMPEYFKCHGYVAMSSGKVYHNGKGIEGIQDNDWPRSWSTNESLRAVYSPKCMPSSEDFGLAAGSKCPHSRPPNNNVQTDGGAAVEGDKFYCTEREPAAGKFTYCAASTPKEENRFDYQLEDQRIRDSCVDNIRTAKASGKNFYIACGFHKPHVPFLFPAEFLDGYPHWTDIPLTDDPYAPAGMPPAAWHPPADVKEMPLTARPGYPNYSPNFNGTQNQDRARKYRLGYYAATTYSDYLVGTVLDELEDQGLTENTVVALISDHGWHLGEKATWAKMTNFEISLRTPMIIKVPWMSSSHGKTASVLAELVDLYPTLAVLAGLPSPQTIGETVDGTDLSDVFEDPWGTADLKEAAFSQFAKVNACGPQQCQYSNKNIYTHWPTPRREETEVMGYSVRVDGWRYTCWLKFNKQQIRPETENGCYYGSELYDHRSDTGHIDWKGETVNKVDYPNHQSTVNDLHNLVLGYIQKTYPVAANWFDTGHFPANAQVLARTSMQI